MLNIEREIIKFTEFEIAPILCEYAPEQKEYEDYYNNGEIIGNPVWADFEIVEEESDYVDLEKCYEDKCVIVRRISDNKYFKGSYRCWMDENDYHDTTLEEVFPIQVTKTEYV